MKKPKAVSIETLKRRHRKIREAVQMFSLSMSRALIQFSASQLPPKAVDLGGLALEVRAELERGCLARKARDHAQAEAKLRKLELDELLAKDELLRRDLANTERSRADTLFALETANHQLRILRQQQSPTPHAATRRDVYMREFGA